jgi:hypothetical protein
LWREKRNANRITAVKPEHDVGAAFRDITPGTLAAYADAERAKAVRAQLKRERDAKYDLGAAFRK